MGNAQQTPVFDYASPDQRKPHLPPDILVSGPMAIGCGFAVLYCDFHMEPWLAQFRGRLLAISIVSLVAFWFRFRVYQIKRRPRR